MKFLLTSGGVRNDSIRAELERLLGRPIAESRALCIPTAQWGHPLCGPESARGFVAGIQPWGNLTSLGWQSLGMLEVTALASVSRDRWEPWVRDTDALLVDGGDATFLAHHLRTSGLDDLIPTLERQVWVGVSAGSMVLTPRIGDRFVEWEQAGSDATLGLVDFCIFPHLDAFPDNTMNQALRWAESVGHPAYVLDDDSAIVVDGGQTSVVSEGRWERLG